MVHDRGISFGTLPMKWVTLNIPNIQAGEYNLYAWVSAFIGVYVYDVSLTITSGSAIDVVKLTFEPQRHSPTLREIGIPDSKSIDCRKKESKMMPPLMFLKYNQDDDLFFSCAKDHIATVAEGFRNLDPNPCSQEKVVEYVRAVNGANLEKVAFSSDI